MHKNKYSKTSFFFILIVLSGCFSSTLYSPRSLTGKTLRLLVTKTVNYKDSSSHEALIFKFSKTNKYLVYYEGKLTQSGYFTYKRKKSNKVQIICTYRQDNTPAAYEVDLAFNDARSGTWVCPYYKSFAGSHAGDFILE